MNLLERAAKHHSLWCNMVSKLGCNKSMVEDVVQDMYIKIHTQQQKGKNIFYGKDVNKFYIWMVLRSIYIDYLRNENKSVFCGFNDTESLDNILSNHEDDSTHYVHDNDYDLYNLYNDIQKEIDSWDEKGLFPYNKTVFTAYMETSVSLRQLAKDTNVSLSSIVNTISKGKEKLKEKFGSDISSYFNNLNQI